MTRYTARPIEAAALKELRTTDDAGRPCVPYTATDDDAGSPLRCCLLPIQAGERIALVSYAPLRRWAAATGARPGAYDEQGPVFLHAAAEDCAGYAPDPGRYPFDRPGALRTLRRYDARGHIAGGRLLEIPADATAGFDTALDEAFTDPDVTLVHVRAVEYGCLHFEVRRP
ncbi:DUF1203 domain-containing protein [Streptomyces kunmingensis]|uniref:DUF1203 domain-containing protein n=1 Tax=Streptomyces kunmingensis TaxID=68225 RepID=A0ABU6CCT6_9ACTN|nr:DUF1203 domain-containing protein [Streptomyces kunmingensis]MEB3962427.1 DUF1203 domain-containing protein [Streptomyces kunmingensis]